MLALSILRRSTHLSLLGHTIVSRTGIQIFSNELELDKNGVGDEEMVNMEDELELFKKYKYASLSNGRFEESYIQSVIYSQATKRL